MQTASCIHQNHIEAELPRLSDRRTSTLDGTLPRFTVEYLKPCILREDDQLSNRGRPPNVG